MTGFDFEKAKYDLIQDEGLRVKMYPDSKGVWTIGVGHNMNRPISRNAALLILTDDMVATISDLNRCMPWWGSLDPVRQRVLLNMCFNLGIDRLASFRKMLSALQAQQYSIAAKEMLDSLWAHQVGARADRLAKMMETGKDLDVIQD
jgi:lysozyme